MGRIYMAYFMRRVFRSQTVRTVLSIGSLVAIASLVSILSVIKNMPSIEHPRAFYNFSVSAFSNTEMSVQIALLALLSALMWYAVDLMRRLTPTNSHSRIS